MKTNQAKKFFFLAVLALTFAFVQQAHAQSSISGRLIDKSSNPISNGFVVLYNQAGAECGGTNTLADGTYTIGGLSAGAYRVFFLGTPAYVALWYNNKTDLDSADPITLTANQVLTGINAQLPDYSALFGSISGRVTNAGGSPLFNVKLQLYNPATGQWGNKISTASDGTYSFTWLWPGSYKVAFWGIQGQYLQQWYNNKADMVSADPITVTANNATSGIDAQLAAYNSALLGSISGTMTDPCANPLPEVEVTLYDQTNLLWGDVIYTDAEGTYSFTDLWPGSYKVFFGGTVGEEQWYDNKPDIDSADPIQVTANNAATGINALLGPCGTTTTVVTTILPTTTSSITTTSTVAVSTTSTTVEVSSSSTTTAAVSSSSTTTVDVSSSSTTTVAVSSSSTTTATAAASSTTTSTAGAASSTTTTAAASTTTTVPAGNPCLKVVPKKVGVNYINALHFFVFTGSEDTVFARGDRPEWNTDSIKTLMKLKLMKRAMLALVFINAYTAEAGTYEVTIGDCAGELELVAPGQ